MAQQTAADVATHDGPGLETLAWTLLAIGVVAAFTGYARFPAAGLLLGGVVGGATIVAWGLYTGGVHEVAVLLAAIGAAGAWLGAERVGYEVLAGMPPFARLTVAGGVAAVAIGGAIVVASVVR